MATSSPLIDQSRDAANLRLRNDLTRLYRCNDELRPSDDALWSSGAGPSDLVLDVGALDRLLSLGPDVLAALEATARGGHLVHVPTLCLAEATSSPTYDAALEMWLHALNVVPLTREVAQQAAQLAATVYDADPTDAVVVATAAALDATVLSTRPGVRLLAGAHQPPLAVLNHELQTPPVAWDPTADGS